MGYIGTKPADAALTSSDLEDGIVTAAKIATDAVETAKVKDVNVTAGKLAATQDLSTKTITLPATVAGLGTGIDVTSQITGTVPTANLGSGSASSTTILYGDQTYKAEPVGGSSWQAVTTGATLSAVAGNGYPINTTSNACTVTLPAGSVGDTIEFVDYAGTWDTNAVTLEADGSEKIKGSTDDGVLNVERQGIKIVYVDATQGWEAITGVNVDTAPAISPPSYDIEFLVIGGGGGGGKGGYAAGGGAGGYIESTQSVQTGFAITIAVGDGGDGGGGNPETNPTASGDSSISGSGITDKTADGGGAGGINSSGVADGGDGGSGGGGRNAGDVGGTATAGQGYDGGDGAGASNYGCGGGGGSSALGADATTSVGGDGGDGTANDITGASVTYAGGGGGGTYSGGTAGSGGTGGGGDAGAGGGNNVGVAGTDGLGGGGGGASSSGDPSGSYVLSGDGGSGIVILRMLTANYSSTVSGNETPIVDGDYTVLKFINTAGGSYTT